MMTKRLLTWIFTSVFSLTVLAGCGFHLRGNYPLPEMLTKTHFVGGPDIELNQLMKERLEKQGAQIVAKDEATAALVITEVLDEQEVLTKDGSGRASSYEFIYTVNYNAYNAQGESLFGDEDGKTAKQTRILSYNPTQELQFEEDKEFMYEDMRDEVILQIMRQLSTL